jgi:phosphopantothenoylcysteine decarboxylase/phosphopantothenate--cysteine ligase
MHTEGPSNASTTPGAGAQPAADPAAPSPAHAAGAERPIALVTAGPTEEPIDEVRFLGNRSSGRMGLAIARALAERGFAVRLAVGPIRVAIPDDPRIEVLRFRTSQDLEALLRDELPKASLVVMAAAVADFRPQSIQPGKLRRTDGGLSLALEPVPDLLASTRSCRRPGSTVVGFALEPAERLRASALDKLARKDLSGIVANPLETMDAPDIDGTLFLRDGTERSPGGPVAKDAFAGWLAGELTRIARSA